MPTPYPLKPVITENLAFSVIYDAHPESLNLVSACLSPQEAEELLNQGAQFSSMLFLDGAGRGLLSRVRQDARAEGANFPEIVEAVLERHNSEGITRVHDLLEPRGIRSFFAAGG